MLAGAFFHGAENIGKLSFLAEANNVVASYEDVINAIQSNTLHILRYKSVCKAAIIFLCAGISVSVMTYLKFPVSATQSVIGAVIGWGLIHTGRSNLSCISEFFLTWIINPLCSAVTAYVLVRVYNAFFHREIKSLRIWYLLSGILASYSIGINSSSLATAFYYDPYFDQTGVCANLLCDARLAAIAGAAAICIGVLTFSKPVMTTVGKNIADLNQSEGFLVITAMAVTVILIEKTLKIPVSTSQTVVGAACGAGLVHGRKNVNFGIVKKVFAAWFFSPVVSGTLAYLIAEMTQNYF